MVLLYVFLVIILVYCVMFRRNTKQFRKLMKDGSSNISSVPILGVAYHFIGNNQARMKALQYVGLEATKAGGVAAAWFGPMPYVVITDAVAADIVLKECLDKDYVMKLLKCIIGDGLIIAPLAVWRTRRRILMPTFVYKNLKEFVKIFSRQSHIMAEQLRMNVGKGPFPIWNYLASNNMDTVCEAVFGIQMHVQKNPEHPFLNSFNEASRIIAARLCQPWLHSDMIFKLLPRYQNVRRTRKVLYNFIDEIILKKLNDIHVAKNKNNGLKPFLELLIESSVKENGPYNDRELREETLTLTIAGTDTSAAGAAFVLLALAKHQDVQDKVYQELLDLFGDSTEELTADSLKKLEYMDAAIKEAMRLYPSAPVILRKVTNEVTLPSGLILPADCGILINIWALHRNQKYWGEDAEVFRPERFLNTPFKHPAQYMPFSYGPRGCPGSRFAMLAIKVTLTTLLRQYRIFPVDDKPHLSFELMMKDANDFRVQIELRNYRNCEK